jgi:hypothetical protein
MFHQIVYQPLLPIFDPSSVSTQIWQNVQRYLYPALAALPSPEGRGFLAYLESLPSELRFDEDAMFECWITIASVAVSSKQLGIRSVDPERMKKAIWHEDFSIRLKAFAIYTQNEDLLEARSVAGIQACFAYNAALHVVGYISYSSHCEQADPVENDLNSDLHFTPFSLTFSKRLSSLNEPYNASHKDTKRSKV